MISCGYKGTQFFIRLLYFIQHFFRNSSKMASPIGLFAHSHEFNSLLAYYELDVMPKDNCFDEDDK